MRVGIVVLMVLSLILGMVIGREIEFGAARQPERVSPVSTDVGLSAEMMRKGEESFGRSRYGEAREYFQRAILSDPASTNGWSWYDLALIYTIAEQFKDHGKIVESTAPAPESTAAPSPEPIQEPKSEKTSEQAASEQTAKAKAAPDKSVTSTAPAKAPKVISNPSGKTEEPAKKASAAPESAPVTKVQPVPAPTSLPPTSGVKRPEEKEGC